MLKYEKGSPAAKRKTHSRPSKGKGSTAQVSVVGVLQRQGLQAAHLEKRGWSGDRSLSTAFLARGQCGTTGRV